MNNIPKKPLTITVTGIITIAQDEVEQLMQQFFVASRTWDAPPLTRSLKVTEGDGKLPRLAFSVKETAKILGICQKTVYRLIRRGLLTTSLALRTKLIAKSEIERFLRDTSREA
jgi:predicted DNA-binding transcriptional regulator AlpA